MPDTIVFWLITIGISLLDMLPDLDEEYRSWENDHRLENGLFWLEDVRDGMEESY